MVVDILFECRFDDEWPRSVKQVVECNIVIIKNGLATVPVEEGKQSMRGRKNEVFVEEVQDKFGVTQVTESSVVHEQTPKKLEFSQCEVAGLHGSHAFVTIKSNTDVGLSDHGHIVGTVSDCQSDNL